MGILGIALVVLAIYGCIYLHKKIKNMKKGGSEKKEEENKNNDQEQ